MAQREGIKNVKKGFMEESLKNYDLNFPSPQDLKIQECMYSLWGGTVVK